ncbi:cell wall-active antibiotics response protein LiaF [Paenibacillus massiliensis]|uniref:cell wall-active antibiotics response protein LiaF n=1 Tax=Paenibacillus massiliensis TaxID=225917 RepID=UPI00036D31AE|nr:cell wall-active antibiotics response protein LiaF [Paenibacillus massiliensis]
MLTRNRMMVITVMVIGILLLTGRWMGFFTIVALLLILLGLYKLHKGKIKKGYTFMAVGGGLIVLDNLLLVFGLIAISLGVYYWRSRKLHPQGTALFKQNFMSNYRWDEIPWTLQDTSVWHVIGEMKADLSLALPEERDTVFFTQGVLGDVEFRIPEYYGVEIEAFVMFGQIQLGRDRDAGALNRVSWRSPNYDTCEFKVKVIVSYVVGDVRIHFI